VCFTNLLGVSKSNQVDNQIITTNDLQSIACSNILQLKKYFFNFVFF
jgi:hypothetical protein